MLQLFRGDCCIEFPLAVQLQNFLDHIPDAALTAVERGDIGSDVTDLRRCVGRGAGQSDELHGEVIRDVVAHIEHIIYIEIVIFGVLLQDRDLVVDVQEDIPDAKVVQALADPFGKRAGNDDDPIAFPDSQLERIAVPGAHPPDLLASLENLNAPIGHNPIDVEYECPDGFKFFQYAHGDNALLLN